jgi:hypothetical protein
MPGVGVIVEVGRDTEPFGIDTQAARTEVEETFGYVQKEVATLKSKLDSIENGMLDLIKNFEVKDIDAELEKIDWDKVNFPTPRDFVEVVLNKAWPTSVPVKPILEDFEGLDFSYIEPIPPEAFEGYFSFTEHPYSSEIRAQLVANVLKNLVDGGTGLSQLAHGAIIDRERTGRLRNQSSTMRDAMHAVGALGVRVTGRNGQASAVIAEVFKAQTHADQDALNLITEKDYELTVRSKEFSETLATELEKLFSGEWDSSENRRFEAGKAEFELSYRSVEFNLEIYKQKGEWIRTKVDVLKRKAEAISAKNESLTRQYVAEWDGHKSNVDAVASENSSKIELRKLDVETYRTEVEAAASQQAANLQGAQFDFQQMLSEIDTELKVHSINTDGYKTEADLKNAVLGTLSKIIAQVVASTIGVMNASASMGFSGSEGKSSSVSNSASISENHSGEL